MVELSVPRRTWKILISIVMKNTAYLLSLLLIMLLSCSKDEKNAVLSSNETLPKIIEIDDNTLEDVIISYRNKKTEHFIYSDKYLIPNYFKEDNVNMDVSEKKSVDITFLKSKMQSLNFIITSGFNNKVLSISALKNKEGVLNGLILYFLDRDGSLQVVCYSKVLSSKSEFELVNFPVKYTTGINSDHILFLSRSAFEFSSSSIEVMGLEEIEILSSRNKIDELSILYFAIKHDLKKSKKIYYDFIGQTQKLGVHRKSSGPTPLAGPEGCGLTHHCNDNTLGSACAPFAGGCRAQPCAYEVIGPLYYSYGMEDELDT
jgi:hypothetical protein